MNMPCNLLDMLMSDSEDNFSDTVDDSDGEDVNASLKSGNSANELADMEGSHNEE